MPDTSGHARPAMLDTTTDRQNDGRSVLLLMVWCSIEAAVFTFALRPTMSELVSDLTGLNVNPIVLAVPLWVFLTIIIAGSFACIQELNDAIKAKALGKIVNMILVEIVVAMFQVLFLYRQLVDAMAPWLAQRGLALGVVGTLVLASVGWVAVRGLTWYLFGRTGAPALAAVLNRHSGKLR